MSSPLDIVTAERLAELLTRLYGCHEELRGLLQQQQQAIRQCDALRLEALRDRCETSAARIMELEESRRLLVGRARMRDLAEPLPEPLRSRLTALSAALRAMAEETAAINRVNSGALQMMLQHFQGVYKVMARMNRAGGYSAKGQTAHTGGAFLLDAVA